MDDRATYVYCVARASTRPRVARAPAGLPDAAPPRLLDAGAAMWLVCASVPLASFGSGVLEASLRDLAWVGDVAVAHESVVEHFADQKNVTVVPMKLFTMFSSDERALEAMQGRRRSILAAAKRIAGCEEWGVRVTRKASGPVQQNGLVRPTSGAGFLTAKKEARDLVRERVRTAADSAEQVYATLSAISRDARRRDDAPEGAAPPLLDAAFLVPTIRRARFKTAARRLAVSGEKSGTEITVTGPWPAYNFVQEPVRS